jgi:hypothetical protein
MLMANGHLRLDGRLGRRNKTEATPEPRRAKPPSGIRI